MSAGRVRRVITEGVRLAIREDRRTVALLAGANVLTLALSVALAPAMQQTLAAFRSGDSGSGLAKGLVEIVGIALLVGLLGTFVSTRAELLGEKLRISGTYRFQTTISRLELEDFDNPEILDCAQRAERSSSRYEVDVIQNTFDLLSGVSRAAGLVLGALIIAPVLSIVVLIAFLPIFGVASRIGDLRFATNSALSELERRTYYLSWLFVSRVPAAELRSLGIAGRLNSEFREVGEQRIVAVRKLLRAQMKLTLLLLLTISAILGAGVWLAMESGVLAGMNPGSVGAVLATLAGAGSSVTALGWPIAQLVEASQFIDDRHQLEDYVERHHRTPLELRQHEADSLNVLELRDVSYRYPNSERSALTRINLLIERGSTVALVGPNGSGKTTLSRLIAQLIPPTEGKVLWNGTDTADLDRASLRRRIAVAHQAPFLFLHTVRDNVAFGRGSVDEQEDGLIVDALRSAQASAFGATEESLDQQIGPEFGGIQPSGGQAQAISVARSMYANRELIILDEPTSSIDPSREAEMMRSIRKYAANRTAVIVAHRLSAVRFADCILVLDDGKIVEQGSHQDLVGRPGGLYAALYAAHRSELV